KHEWPRPIHSVLTFAEYRYIRIDAQVASLARSLENFQKAKEYYSAQHKGFEAPLAAVNKQYGLVPVNAGGLVVPRVLERTEIADILKKAPRLQVRDVSEEFRQDYLVELKGDLEDIDVAMKSARERRDKLVQEKSKLNAEDLTEKQRITDLKLKFKRMLADCDLLIVPRMTLLNVADENQNIPY